MVELELTRSSEDRRRYDLADVGALRFEGMLSRRATAEAGAATWAFDRRGFWRTTIEATDAAGAVVGSFDPRALRRGGALRWAGRAFELRPASMWKDRYALAEGERELAVLDARSWGKRPVRIEIDEPGALDAGLLLFAAFVVRGLAEDTSAAAGAAVATAAPPS